VSTKQIITLCALIVLTAPLHVLAVKWLSDRHIFCRDGVVNLVPGYQQTSECQYPEQILSLEDGHTQKLGICRCKR